jgi:hypothetical protein
MAPFARDMGYVDADGEALPPIVWDEAERRRLRARLDVLYFHLYDVTDEADVRYILGTFPIVERKDREAHGCYLTAELVVWHMRAPCRRRRRCGRPRRHPDPRGKRPRIPRRIVPRSSRISASGRAKMAVSDRFGPLFRLEDALARCMFAIELARGKIKGLRRLRKLPHAEQRRGNGRLAGRAGATHSQPMAGGRRA